VTEMAESKSFVPITIMSTVNNLHDWWNFDATFTYAILHVPICGVLTSMTSESSSVNDFSPDVIFTVS